MHDVAFPDLLGKGLRLGERFSRGHVHRSSGLFHYVDVGTIIWT
jgi:hypothetical protein